MEKLKKITKSELMKRIFIVAVMFFAVFWSAGSKSQKPKSNARIEFIDGIEYIHNTETPLYPDRTVTFVEDLTIAGEDKDGSVNFFIPWLRHIDDNENIYIVENKDQVIKVFGSDGKYIKTIGAKGRGPGEFQMITCLAVTKDRKLIVTDDIARRTSFFDYSGKFLKSFQWRKRYSGFYLVKSSSYLTVEYAYIENGRFGTFFMTEIDFNGKEIRSYGEFTSPERLMVRLGNNKQYSSLPDPPHSILTGDQNRDWLYHSLNNKYIIEVYDTSGKLFRKIDRPYEPVPFTKKDAEEYQAKFDDDPYGALRKAARNLKMPKVKTIVSRMTIDDKGNLWIRTNENKIEGDKILTAFDIFDSNGQYYARIWTEFTSFIFKKGKMYRMDTDQETGYQTLKRYKVVWE